MNKNFKIRVKENIGEDSIKTFGKVGTILEVENGLFRDINNYTWTNNYKEYSSIEDVNNQFYNEGYVCKTLFELVEEGDTYKEFTKQDLKTGMIVELRNGKKAMILLGTKDGDIFGGETYGTLNVFDCDLKNNTPFDEISKIYIEQIDIIKIYQPTSNYLRDGIFNESNLELIWERKKEPQPKEMTVGEIEKELGYSVKIVK